jgi:polyphosphate glucokinase
MAKRNVLVIDVGGTNVKVRDERHSEAVKIPSGTDMSAAKMVAAVTAATTDWGFTHVSMGYPGPVVDGRPVREPQNLAAGWVETDFAKAFGKPVRIINDAAMQALGSYHGGRMLFLGLGTGLGSALIAAGTVVPLELAHLPYRNDKTYEDYVGVRGLERLGKRDWRKHVTRVAQMLKDALIADYVVLGGGNSRNLKTVPEGMELGSNVHAYEGGLRMWAPKTAG